VDAPSRPGIVFALVMGCPLWSWAVPGDCVMLTWLRCLLIGHDYSIRREAGNVFLRCQTCGRRSRGWTLEGMSNRPQAQAGERLPAPVGDLLPEIRLHLADR